MTKQQSSLTPLEQRIVALTAEGRSAKEIARAVSIGPRSVERHLDACRHKLGAANNAHLVAVWFGTNCELERAVHVSCLAALSDAKADGPRQAGL